MIYLLKTINEFRFKSAKDTAVIVRNDKLKKGQTLIGVLIALALMAILSQALFTLTTTSYRLVSFNRARIAARHIAQEKIEIIRNLSYDDIGTVGGIPSGSLVQTETTLRNGLSYTVKTSIVYIDDPFDQFAPTDLLPVDYKRVRVDVSWEGLASSSKAPVVVVTDIAPKGIETMEGGGTLSILVFDANALPVSQAQVHITAPTNPAIDLTLQTNENGRIILPGSPICTGCYSINVTKDGYSSDRTYSVSEVANPTKPLQTVLENQVTEISFAIDKVSIVNFASKSDRESEFSPLPSTVFTLKGEKIIGTDINDLPVYKYVEELTTGGDGEYEIANLEWDNYTIILPPTSGKILSGTNPLLPIKILPDTNYNVTFSLADSSTNSLLAIFTNGASPVASVSAVLSNNPDYSSSKFTGGENDPDFGQVFYSDLDIDIYTIAATASGYIDYSENVSVSGNKVHQATINAQ